MRPVFLLFIAFVFCLPVFGQKFLQLEKIHSPKTRKYYPGDEITFQLKGGQWYTRVIEDISYDQQLVLFAKGQVSVDSIIAFRSFKNEKWSRPIGNQLINFAIAYTVYSVIDEALQEDSFENVPNTVVAIPVASAGTGLALKKFFKKRTFRMTRNKEGDSKRWRLRVLDLTVK